MSLKSQLESLLFIAVKPVSLKKLAVALKVKSIDVADALKELAADYEADNRGLRLLINNKQYQLATAEANATLVKEFLNDETKGELSVPSLEALTIIAYRGPLAKRELDRIRGVNCSLIVHNLLLRGLISEKYNKKLDESFYTVTHEFLRFLGLDEVSKLPDYEKLHAPDTLDSLLQVESADEQSEAIKKD